MKRKLPLSLLAVFALVGLASCGGGSTTSIDTSTGGDVTTGTDTGTSDGGTSSTIDDKAVQRFETVQLSGPLTVGATLDLAEQITVHYTDGTTSHVFVITEGEGYTVSGTIVTFNQIGSYNLLVKAGSNNKSLRFPVSVESLERQAFNEWFNSIEKNYTVLAVSPTEDDTSLSLGGWAMHKGDNWFSQFFGASINNVMAKLSDGNYYEGSHLNVESLTKFDLEFNPGHQNWNASYGSVALNTYFDASNFSSTLDEEGNEIIAGDATAAETFVNFACALTYGGDATSIQLLSFDEDPDSGEKSALFAVGINAESGVVYDYYIVESVGTTTNTVIDEYCVSGAIPEAIQTTAIEGIIEKLNTSKNYTLSVTPTYLDGNGTPVDSYAYASLFPTKLKSIVTADSISVIVGDATAPSSGYLTHESKVYEYKDDGEAKTATEVAGATDVWTAAPRLVSTSFNGLEDLTFTSYEQTDTTHTYGSTCGENNGVTNTTAFTKSLFDQYPLQVTDIVGGGSTVTYTTFGEVMCSGVKSTSGATFALCENGQFVWEVVEDTSLTISYLWSLATVGANKGASYLLLEFSYTDIGTSVAPDLSEFIAVIA